MATAKFTTKQAVPVMISGGAKEREIPSAMEMIQDLEKSVAQAGDDLGSLIERIGHVLSNESKPSNVSEFPSLPENASNVQRAIHAIIAKIQDLCETMREVSSKVTL